MTVGERLQEATFRTIRGSLALRRPSSRANQKVLGTRRESLDRLILRDAVAEDIATLAALHVATWNDTSAPIMVGPPVAVREQQWRQAFAQPRVNFTWYVWKDLPRLARSCTP